MNIQFTMGQLVNPKFQFLYMELLTPTTRLADCNCCKGSIILSEPISKLVIDPRITTFQTTNKARGIAVARTIAVLQIDILMMSTIKFQTSI